MHRTYILQFLLDVQVPRDKLSVIVLQANPLHLRSRSEGGILQTDWELQGYYSVSKVDMPILKQQLWSLFCTLTLLRSIPCPRSNIFQYMNNASWFLDYDSFPSLDMNGSKTWSETLSQHAVLILMRFSALVLASHAMIFGFDDRENVPIKNPSTLVNDVNRHLRHAFDVALPHSTLRISAAIYRKLSICLKVLTLQPSLLDSCEGHFQAVYGNIYHQHLLAGIHSSPSERHRASAMTTFSMHQQGTAAGQSYNPDHPTVSIRNRELLVMSQNMARAIVFGIKSELSGSAPPPAHPQNSVPEEVQNYMEKLVTEAVEQIPSHLTQNHPDLSSMYASVCFKSLDRATLHVAAVVIPGVFLIVSSFLFY